MSVRGYRKTSNVILSAASRFALRMDWRSRGTPTILTGLWNGWHLLTGAVQPIGMLRPDLSG